MKNGHQEIDEEVRRVRGRRRKCPSSEELARHLEGESAGEESQLLDLHLHNCPSCAAVLERLREPEEVPASGDYRRRQEREIDDVARRLGFDRGRGGAGPLRVLRRLWQMNVPLYVPLAAGAVLLLVLFTGRMTTAPPVEFLGTARFIGLEQSVSRSGGEDQKVELLKVGELVIIDYRVDDPTFLPGEDIHCAIREGKRQLQAIDVVIGPDLSMLIPVRISEPGTYDLHLHLKTGDPPFDTFTLDVRNDSQGP